MAKLPDQKVVSRRHIARLEKERILQRYAIIAISVVAVAVLAILLYGILDQSVFKAMQPVAKVGSENVTTADFQKQVKFDRYRMINQLADFTSDPIYLQFFGSYLTQLQTQLDSPQMIGQQVIDTQIENILVEREAQRRGITISQAEWDKAVEEAFGFYANGTPTPTVTPTIFPTETLSPQQMTLLPPTSTPAPTEAPTLEATPTGPAPTEAPAEVPTEVPAATLEPTADPASAATVEPTVEPSITPSPTPYTRDAYQQNFDNYADSVKDLGINKDDLRQFIRFQLLRDKVREAIANEVSTTAEQVWARHILVATEEEANAVLTRLNNGENFADVASEVSIDTSNKDSGGDLGWFTRDRMVPEFAEVAFSLQVGQISQPVKTDFGYHIIQVLGHEQNRPLNADALAQAQQKAYQDWLEAAKTENNVVIYDEQWTEVVPSVPAIPASIRSVLIQMQQQQQQPQFPSLPEFEQQQPGP